MMMTLILKMVVKGVVMMAMMVMMVMMAMMGMMVMMGTVLGVILRAMTTMLRLVGDGDGDDNDCLRVV